MVFFLCSSSAAIAEEVSYDELVEISESLDLPGTLLGKGTYFELSGSEYLNVSIRSSEEIVLFLESVPDTITMEIAPQTLATSTVITVSGLLPNTAYFKYEDDFYDPEEFVSDINGQYVYEQDISTAHVVFILSYKSTKFIVDDATGGDCYLIGSWDPAIKTCTMNTDVTETIQIDSDNITLDGNGHSIKGSGTGSGIYGGAHSNITIRNLNIGNFTYGVYFYYPYWQTNEYHINNNRITGNTFTDISNYAIYMKYRVYNVTITDNIITNSNGVYIYFGHTGTVERNVFENSALGLYIISNEDFYILNNTLTGTGSGRGAYLYDCAWSYFSYNLVSGYSVGLTTDYGWGTVSYNTFFSNSYGHKGGTKAGFDFYYNNFVDNAVQVKIYAIPQYNYFSYSYNYWNDFDVPDEGCYDTDRNGYCDGPYYVGEGRLGPRYDRYPRTSQVPGAPPPPVVNDPPTADAGPDRTVECATEGGAQVTLDGSGSSDPDGDTLTYLWEGPFGAEEGMSPTVTIPLGTHTVTLTVVDGYGETDTDNVIVTVEDTTPPSTSAVLDGTLVDDEWFVSEVDVSLFATESCTGVNELRYVLDGAGQTVVSGDSTEFAIVEDGEHALEFGAVDNAGNEEPPQVLYVDIFTAGITERVSVDGDENQASGYSWTSSVSADGRYVAFSSYDSNLVEGDTNSAYDVFVRDREMGTTERVSVDSGGNQANKDSVHPLISADGRYVAFSSAAANLVPDDTNGHGDVFVHDRETGITGRVSVDGNGNQGNSYSGSPSISADGRYVVFASKATNLVPGDTNGLTDIFLHDTHGGVTDLVSVSSGGEQANWECGYPFISADGRLVAFLSRANNLAPDTPNSGYYKIFVRNRETGSTEVAVASSGFYYSPSFSADGRYVAFFSYTNDLVPNDTNGVGDVFVYDRQTGLTELVSVDSEGNQANDHSSLYGTGFISSDGRYVAFSSAAANLVPDDTNGATDIFVHDRLTHATERISLDSFGNQANEGSSHISMSADGRYAAFQSYASNLVPDDTNGVPDIFVHDRGDKPTPLTAHAGADQLKECSGPGGASFALDGSMSHDPEGDVLTYTWTGTFGAATGVSPTVTVPLGTHSVTLTVEDGNGNTDADEVVIIVEDTTPPDVYSAITGTMGNNEWYVTDVTISLSAADSCSGVKEIRYAIGGAEQPAVPENTKILEVSNDGSHTVTYLAVDNAGNESTQGSESFKRDATRPEITINGVSDGATYALGLVPEAGYSVTDATSGVASSGAGLTGGDGLGLGTFTYSVTAEDKAGNTAEASAAFKVIATEEGTEALIMNFLASGEIESEMKNSLVRRLLNNADLGALINLIEVQTGNKIDAEAAAILINAVQYLINH
jgi:Tol biopolymer transport system component